MTGPMREVLSRYRRRLDSAVPVPTRPRPKAVCRSAKVFTGWLRTSRTKTDSSTRNVPNVSQRLKPRVNSVSCRSRCARRAGRHAGRRPFDCPPAWDHCEPLLACGFAHDLDRAAQDLVGPLQQAAGEPTGGEEEPHRVRREASNRTGFAPSRSWVEAASTTTTRSRPRVSVTMNRFLPLIFLPASYPRLFRPTVSAPFTLCESINPALGSGSRPSCTRSWRLRSPTGTT